MSSQSNSRGAAVVIELKQASGFGDNRVFERHVTLTFIDRQPHESEDEFSWNVFAWLHAFKQAHGHKMARVEYGPVWGRNSHYLTLHVFDPNVPGSVEHWTQQFQTTSAPRPLHVDTSGRSPSVLDLANVVSLSDLKVQFVSSRRS